MQFVETQVKPSPIAGLGLFAAQRIPKGTIVFRWVAGFDLLWTMEQFNAFPELARKTLYRFGWRHGDGWRASYDESRYTNHSKMHQNITWDPTQDASVALRDIEVGEEILEDYEEFDPEFADYAHLMIEYEPRTWRQTQDEADRRWRGTSTPMKETP